MSRINEYLRGYNLLLRKRLKNKDFSLISDNCNGGCILHDLGLKFNSPFINLWIELNDYIRVLQNLNYYLAIDTKIEFMVNNEYPIGVLGGDVKIHFVHYKSNKDA